MLKRFMSILVAAVVILAALPVFIPAPARAYLHPGALSCTGGGISGANATDSFYDPTLFTTAQQSGQTSILPTHPMSFCVPAQDYHVGYDTTLTLKDPQANPPSGCSYIAPGTRHGPQLLCNSTNSITVDGYDFTGAISAIGTPIALEWGSNFNSASVCTVTNNKFITNASSSFPPTQFAGACARVYKFNQCDGGGLTSSGTQFCVVDNNGGNASATQDMEYNAFIHQWQPRIIGCGSCGGANRTIKYNFVEGLNNQGGGTHGEFDLYGGQGGPYTGVAIEWSNNFIIWDATAVQNDNTATFYASTGAANGYQAVSTTINNNVVVTNTSGTPPTPTSPHLVGHALMAGGWASLGAVTITNNWVDGVGATDCSLNGATTTPDVATVSGNTATLTSGTVTPEVGYNINGTGMTQATITSIVGSVYTFDGPAQNLGSIAITVTPGITSLTSSNNFNLADGSAMGISGARLTAANCVGAHN